MILSKFTKRPGDRKRYTVLYTEWLDTDETVEEVTFEVTPPGALEVDASAISEDGKDVVFFANLGQDGENYTINIRIETSGGQIKNDQILFSVRGD